MPEAGSRSAQDLSKSGLTTTDIKARPLEDVERSACSISSEHEGYVIPYFDMRGKILPFYRVKLLDGPIKYKQLKNTPNHVYFPPKFLSLLKEQKQKLIFIVEGEKKAAALCKLGYAAIAFGGVDSWRTRAIILPKDTQFAKLNYTTEVIKAEIPSGEFASEISVTGTATGFDELLEYARHVDATFVIVYDSDELYGVKSEVQRAAAALGYELRHRGFKLPQIKQLVLPTLGEEKMGVDDYLEHGEGGADEFHSSTYFKQSTCFPSTS